MTTTFTRHPPHQAAPSRRAAGRVERLRVATLRDELLAPLNAVIALSELLLGEAEGVGPDEFYADLQKINLAGQELLTRVCELLEPGSPATSGADADGQQLHRRVRHDLLNLLNPVINYGEMWLEDADEQLLDAFADDLRALSGYGKRCADRIDAIFALRDGGTAAERAEVAVPDWGAPA